MGIGALGIGGGIGRGVIEGMQLRDQHAANLQLQQQRDFELKRQADERAQAEEIKAIPTVSTVANGIKSADAAKAADAAATAGAGIAAKDDMQTAIQADAPAPDATTAGIMATPAPSVDAGLPGGTTDAPAAPAAGIKDSQANRVSNLASSLPRKAPAAAPPMGDLEASRKAWPQVAAQQAAVYAKYGHADMAAKMLASADDAQTSIYYHHWQDAMRDFYKGSTDSAVSKLTQLYNTGMPDGMHAEVKKLSRDQFMVTQYDKDGKVAQQSVQTTEDLMRLGQTALSPAEMVKTMGQESSERRAERIAQSRENVATTNFERSEANSNRRVAAQTDALTKTLASKEKIAESNNDTKRDVADTRASTAGAGKANPEDKAAAAELKNSLSAARSEVNTITKGKVVDKDAQTYIQSQAEKYVRGGQDAMAAARAAYQDYDKHSKDAANEAHAHTDDVLKNGKGWFDSSKIESGGDKDVVSGLGKNVTPESYRAAYQKKALSQRLSGGASSPAAAPAAGGKYPEGMKLNGPGGKQYIVRNGQPVPL